MDAVVAESADGQAVLKEIKALDDKAKDLRAKAGELRKPAPRKPK